jgi:hypothetical protein
LVFVAAVVGCAVAGQERKRASGAAFAGIALPLLLVGAYLAAHGALVSMGRQAFGANANYFGEKKVAAGLGEIVLGNVSKLWAVSRDCAPGDAPLTAIGYAGLVAGGVWLSYRLWRTRERGFFLRAFPILLSGAGLFGFSLLDLQKCSDLTPLLPYVALGGAGVLLVGAVAAARFVRRVLPVSPPPADAAPGARAGRGSVIAAVLLIALVLWYGTRDAFAQARQTGLAAQRALAAELTAQLGPGDRIQQFGDTVALVLTRRANATRFVHLGEKQGLGILTAEGISMADLAAQLEAANPRVITLSRAKNKEWAAPLYAWLENRYRLDSTYSASEGGTLKETDVYWLK